MLKYIFPFSLSETVMDKRYNLLIIFALSALLFLPSCKTAAEHHASLPSTQERRMTVGVVQKEIKVGMPQTKVAEILGSPNIVSRDASGKESWIYDKLSTDIAYSKDSGGVQTLVLGWGNDIGGAAAPGYSASSGASSTTQRTLTVIIKFKGGVVDEFSYHASRF